MQRLFKFCYRYALLVILAILALTGYSLWQAKELTVNVSTDSLIPADSPLRLEYERVTDEFGSDQLALIYVEDDELFTEAKLTTLRDLSKQLKALPQVQRVESLFTVNDIRSVNGWVDTSPLLRKIPSHPEKLGDKQSQAIDNPLMLRSIISEDGNATLITLYLKPYEEIVEEREEAAREAGVEPEPLDKGDYDKLIYHGIQEILLGQNEVPAPTLPPGAEKLDPALQEKILASRSNNVIQPLDYRTQFDRVFQVGSPALHVLMAQYIFDDMSVMLPLACLILVILLGVMLRSVQCAIIPVINFIISTAFTGAMMVYFGVPLSMLTYIVPALILIIGATEDVHILNEYRMAKAEGQTGEGAVAYIAQHIGLTLFLTGVTTSMGFAVTGISDLAIMQEFGIVAAIAILSRFLVSLTFLPAWLRIFGRFIKPAQTKEGDEGKDRLCDKVARFLEHKLIPQPRNVLLAFIAIALPCVILIPKIRVSNDLIGFLKPDSEIVQQLDLVAEKLSGSKVIYITFYGSENEFKKHQSLRQLSALSDWLRADERVDTVTSVADYIALVNQAMTGGDIANRNIPENDSLIAQYLVFFHSSDLQPYVANKFGMANVVLRSNISDSSELNQLVADIREALNSGQYGSHRYKVTGKSVMVASAVDRIINGQVISLTSMTALLFAIVGLLFLSTRAASLAVLSNLFPVVMVFGVMAAFGVTLNVGTCMVAAITIGIAVDDTLHMMVRYNKELKRLKNEHLAILSSVKAEFYPVLTTSLGLAGGFVILGFSSFVPVMQFGLLSALVMILALIADVILTPVLLSTTRLITLWDVLGFNLRKALIERSVMFEGLTKWQAKKLILLANLEEREIGEYVVREGEVGDSMYVIIDGELEVSKKIDGNRIILSRLTLGDVFGEVALISDIKRTADVTATTDTRLLRLNWSELENLQRYNPFLSSRLFLNLSRILGQRLKSSLERIESPAPFPTRTPFKSRSRMQRPKDGPK
ncbi:MMPL family transporter [Cerasicoccus fimbriatus]|uniref:MMPL family transporter n=1 Tax=Cerasicoccus fimbriatus TaxID=3014554 RepID=UPI0022B46DF4|nr:MMPL family transporter [Cerasicoccus sp. TK19100]